MIQIIEYTNPSHNKVIEHILKIENDEFHLNLTLNDQPDLASIENSYQKQGDNFWLALNESDEVVGTIALFNLGNHIGDLRKMFVKPEYRGKESGVSKNLLDTLINWAVSHHYQKIFLETNSAFKAAMRFYEKNGFQRVAPSQLPSNFPVIKVAEYFYVKELTRPS